MPTRRAVIEAALFEERIALWGDLSNALEIGAFSSYVSDLIRRIRLASEALGYPTRWLDVPLPAMNWTGLVEDVPELGIVGPTVDWSDVRFTAGSRGIDLYPCEAEHRSFHAWRV